MSEEVVAALREQVDKLSLMIENQQQAFIHVLNALNNMNARTEQLENGLNLLCSSTQNQNSRVLNVVLPKEAVTEKYPWLEEGTKFKQVDGKWLLLTENEFYNGVAGLLYRGVCFSKNVGDPTLEDKYAILQLKWVTQNV